MEYCFYYNTPIGRIGICAGKDAVLRLYFGGVTANAVFRETPLIKSTYMQLTEYFNGERKAFDLPLDLRGTVFQKKVWDALNNIPYGQTCSYRQIAGAIGNKNAARAVGMANNRNPLPIIIPCHRVIGADGSLTGYAGGIDIKRMLLSLEKKYSGAA